MSSSLSSKAKAKALAEAEAAPPRIVTPTHGSNSNSNGKPPMSPTGKPLKSSSRLLLQSSTTSQIKIFVLLLQPQSKIFELIQLVYNNDNNGSGSTTIGDLLDLIPSHATEPALGSQTYTGLCRPKTTASTSTTSTTTQNFDDLDSPADFGTGEILVGIPHGFTASQVSSLSHQILTNPKIVKLLQRADPLGRDPKRKKHRRHHPRKSVSGKSSSSRGRHLKSKSTTSKLLPTPTLPFHPEVDESQWTTNTTIEAKLESERQMKQAMEHAAAEAAAANAACGGTGTTTTTTRALRRHDSLVSHDASTTSSLQELDYVDYDTTTTNNDNSTMDDSFSSWSKSFDASFSQQSSICSSRTIRAHKRQVRAQRRIWLLQQCAMVGFAIMIAMYCLDPQHQYHHPIHQDDYNHNNHTYNTISMHHHHDDNGKKSTLWHLANQQREAPLAWKGLFQVACLLFALYKWQLMSLYTRKAHQWTRHHGTNAANAKKKRYFPTLYMSDELHVCPFLQASGKAWKRFQSKYAQKLVRNQHHEDASSPPTNVVLPPYSSSRPLRSFSLKAGGAHSHHHEE